MERVPTSTREQPKFIEEKERFGAKIREVFKSEPNSLLDEIKDIEYETSDGKTLSVKSLLPEGWKLIRSSVLGMDNPIMANMTGRVIVYEKNYWIPRAYVVPKEEPLPEPVSKEGFIREVFPGPRGVIELSSSPQVERKGFFISLLHEIGHSQVFKAMSEKKQIEFIERISRLNKKIKQKIIEDQDEKEADNKNERESWAWALKTFRRLRKEGVDLEPELDTPDKLLKGIHAALNTRQHMVDPVEFTKIIREALFQE